MAQWIHHVGMHMFVLPCILYNVGCLEVGYADLRAPMMCMPVPVTIITYGTQQLDDVHRQFASLTWLRQVRRMGLRRAPLRYCTTRGSNRWLIMPNIFSLVRLGLPTTKSVLVSLQHLANLQLHSNAVSSKGSLPLAQKQRVSKPYTKISRPAYDCPF
jgi:hypothetical protein